MTLIEFLLARIAEDEAVAQETAEGGDSEWCAGWLGSGIRHLVRNVDVECYEPGHEDDVMLCGQPSRYAGGHIARWDPARVIADCEAKRRIVEEAARLAALPLTLPVHIQFVGAREALLTTCRWLAQPYADHPDYDEAWRP